MSWTPPPDVRRHLRMPFLAFIGLLLLLGINTALAFLAPDWPWSWIVQVLVAAVMVTIVILFSMEVIEQPPIIRLFSGLGFFWVAILFGLSMVDYATR